MVEENEKKHKKMEKPQKKKQKRESEKEEEKGSKEAGPKSSAQTQVKNNPNKKRKLVFPFGNYKNYYGYRVKSPFLFLVYSEVNFYFFFKKIDF